MQSKYYLSTYLATDTRSYLYNISLRHDQSIALWKVTGNQVDLIQYWELERITGIKQHSLSFYSEDMMKKMIDDLLQPYDLSIEQMSGIWGNPEIYKDTDSLNKYADEMKKYSIHEMAHLFSGFLSDSDLMYRNTILVMVVDNGPDRFYYNSTDKPFIGAVIKNGEILGVQNIASPGMIWNVAQDLFSLREGTLMALATACTSEYYYNTILPFSCYSLKDINVIYKWLIDLNKKIDMLKNEDAGILFSGFDERFTISENKTSMAMKIIQDISIKLMESNVRILLDIYNVSSCECYLSVVGGYGLNCPTNSYLMNKFKFLGYTSPACVSDTGIAYGLGLMMLYQLVPNMQFKLKNAYYGQKFNLSDTNISEFDKYIESIESLKDDVFIKDIKADLIVWFNGQAEIGPRALGNRSILGDPRVGITKDKINKIKQRQWWRPVAPIILEDKVSSWFIDAHASPYMLHTYHIKENQKNKVPAILHHDNTSRVQTLNEKFNPLLYKLLYLFYEDTGIPIFCNTSLNDRGEPIINSIKECLHFALIKKIEIVYINGIRIKLKNAEQYKADTPYPRNMSYFNLGEQIKMGLKKQYNPHSLSKNDLSFYYDYKHVFKDIVIEDPNTKTQLDRYKRLLL